jgi:nucleoside-diphosphate-sugar epimerase
MRVFVTGASGWIGSAVVPELLGAGHQVTGLARSEASAAKLAAAGVEAVRGTIEDLEVVKSAAEAADGVIHLAFRHDIAFSGGFEAAAQADRRLVETVGDVLAGSDRPLVIASGVAGIAPGRVVTEQDGRDREVLNHLPSGPRIRQATGLLTLELAERGVRSSVLRLPPTTHGDGDNGFMATLVGVAKQKGVSGYVGDGSNRWPAAHRLDAGHLFRLAVEKAPAGSVLHAIAEEGVPIKAVAEVIGRHLDIPVESVDPQDAGEHFGWLGAFIGLDIPASSTLTRELMGWQPTQPGLLDDLGKGHYFG